jgi:hypothetical protein
MLSGLAASAMLTALIAGVAGAWSPCGFSMVDTIGTAFGDARRWATILACVTFTVGAVLGGAITFGGLASAGQAIGREATGLREAVGAVVALAAALADWRGLRVAPQIRRQVPERWRRTMPLPLAGGLYGILLGLGFTTFVLAFAVWALAGISFAAGSPAVGLLVGSAFGVGRALPVVWMAPGLRNGNGAQRLEGMAAEPRLWLGLRRLDALGLCLCALFLSGTVASAAGLRSATDPSTSGGELVWQGVNGTGMLRLGDGHTSALPGSHPALGQSSIAWQAGGQITIADRSSMTMKAVIPVARLSALAVSDDWVVYRAPALAGVEDLFAVSLLAPTRALEPIASRPVGVIGRPSLDGSTVVFALSTPRNSAIQAVDLASGARHVLRASRSGSAFANPSLLDGRLLYERLSRCTQELRLGSPTTGHRDRLLLSLPSTARRDPGYQGGYEHAYNSASLCHNDGRRGGKTRLGATALTTANAYVTEIPTNPAYARIVELPRARSAAKRPRSHHRLHTISRRRSWPSVLQIAETWRPDLGAATRNRSTDIRPAA